MIRSSRALSTGLGFAAIALWSTTVAFGRSLGEQLGPLTTACLIYSLGGALGSMAQILTGRMRSTIRSSSPRYLLGCGSLFVLYMASLYSALGLAQDRSQALGVGLMNYLWPTLTLLLSVPVLGLRASPALIPGLVAATAGVFLAMTQDPSLSWASLRMDIVADSLPYLLGLVAALSWALYSTLSRRWAGGTQGMAVPLFMLSTGVLLGLARLFVHEEVRWTRRAVFELAYMVVGSNLAYAFWERAMRQGDLVLVAAGSYLTPLLSMITSSLYLGVRAGTGLWLACGLIVLGAILCRRAVSERQIDSF